MSEKFMYQVGNYNCEIEKVKVTKETDKFVTVERIYNKEKYERREAKNSSWHNFFNTFQEAKNYLIEQSENKIKSYEENAEREKQNLVKIINLKEVK